MLVSAQSIFLCLQPLGRRLLDKNPSSAGDRSSRDSGPAEEEPRLQTNTLQVPSNCLARGPGGRQKCCPGHRDPGGLGSLEEGAARPGKEDGRSFEGLGEVSKPLHQSNALGVAPQCREQIWFAACSQDQPRRGPKFSHTKKILLGQKDLFRYLEPEMGGRSGESPPSVP